jgi:hypothetical protein
MEFIMSITATLIWNYRHSTAQMPSKVYLPSALDLLHQSHQHY